jgi:hypothetical protein
MGTRITSLGWYQPGFGTPLSAPHFHQSNLIGHARRGGTGEPPGALREKETIHLCRSPLLERAGAVFWAGQSPGWNGSMPALSSNYRASRELGDHSDYRSRFGVSGSSGPAVEANMVLRASGADAKNPGGGNRGFVSGRIESGKNPLVQPS